MTIPNLSSSCCTLSFGPITTSWSAGEGPGSPSQEPRSEMGVGAALKAKPRWLHRDRVWILTRIPAPQLHSCCSLSRQPPQLLPALSQPGWLGPLEGLRQLRSHRAQVTRRDKCEVLGPSPSQWSRGSAALCGVISRPFPSL